ncbi:MAG TPA: hypothetical protein VM101_00635 [Flavitalea sp.]|nr:hypothetical protein [Flavitalea sp.]
MRIPILLLCVFLVSCGGNASEERKNGYSETPKNDEDSLFQEVMNQHDLAMSKMGKLAGYRKQFVSKIDSVKKLKAPVKQPVIKTYEQLTFQLKEAEDQMNGWMQQFSIDTLQDNPHIRMQYLESEKLKVTTIKEEILSVLSRADSVLKK